MKRKGLWGVALVGIAMFLSGCGSTAQGTISGTTAACTGIFPPNGLTPHEVGSVHILVKVLTGSPATLRTQGHEVASQSVFATTTNRFRPGYRFMLPAGLYLVAEIPYRNRFAWPIESKIVRVQSGGTKHADFVCSRDL